MKIDRTNYESFLIDHIEGNLSREEKETLLSFLKENPDLQAELEWYKKTTLAPIPKETYPEKEKLAHLADKNNYRFIKWAFIFLAVFGILIGTSRNINHKKISPNSNLPMKKTESVEKKQPKKNLSEKNETEQPMTQNTNPLKQHIDKKKTFTTHKVTTPSENSNTQTTITQSENNFTVPVLSKNPLITTNENPITETKTDSMIAESPSPNLTETSQQDSPPADTSSVTNSATSPSVQTLSSGPWEIGIFSGVSKYIGDVDDHSVIKFIYPAEGIFSRYQLSNRFSLRGNFTYAQIGTNASKYKDKVNKIRNLDFKSNLWEFSLIMEMNILYKLQNAERPHHLSPAVYVFAGASAFHFNPQAYYQGKWYELQPLGTEGQGIPAGKYKDKKYPLTQIAVPVGLGAKFSFKNNWNIGMEAGFRKTFTDYLDDVSDKYADRNDLQNYYGNISVALSDRSGEIDPSYLHDYGDERGHRKNKDAYLFVGITISRQLQKSRKLVEVR